MGLKFDAADNFDKLFESLTLIRKRPLLQKKKSTAFKTHQKATQKKKERNKKDLMPYAFMEEFAPGKSFLFFL